MTLEFQPIELAHPADSDGRLVLHGGKLVAILSRLSQDHAENAGRWFLECGFGALAHHGEEFSDLNAAADWINELIG